MSTLPIDSRVLFVEHPTFGIADENEGLHMYTNHRGVTFVGAYWGAWRTYANLPADEVTVTEQWYCTWYMGQNTECGDPAEQARDGFPYCDQHAAAFDGIVAGEARLAEVEQVLDWDWDRDADRSPWQNGA